MTRLTEVLMKRPPYKKFANYKYVPLYKQLRPAALADKVSGKGEGRKVTPCLQEMSLMLVCLRNHDFAEVPCSKEIEAFLQCQKSFDMAKQEKIEKEAKGLISSITGKMPSKLINSMLSRYPQPKKPAES